MHWPMLMHSVHSWTRALCVVQVMEEAEQVLQEAAGRKASFIRASIAHEKRNSVCTIARSKHSSDSLMSPCSSASAPRSSESAPPTATSDSKRCSFAVGAATTKVSFGQQGGSPSVGKCGGAATSSLDSQLEIMPEEEEETSAEAPAAVRRLPEADSSTSLDTSASSAASPAAADVDRPDPEELGAAQNALKTVDTATAGRQGSIHGSSCGGGSDVDRDNNACTGVELQHTTQLDGTAGPAAAGAVRSTPTPPSPTALQGGQPAAALGAPPSPRSPRGTSLGVGKMSRMYRRGSAPEVGRHTDGDQYQGQADLLAREAMREELKRELQQEEQAQWLAQAALDNRKRHEIALEAGSSRASYSEVQR